MDIKKIKDLAKKLSKATTEAEALPLLLELDAASAAFHDSRVVDLGLLNLDSILADLNMYSLNYDTDTEYECHSYYGRDDDDYNPCANDYCRCGVIRDVTNITFKLDSVGLPEDATEIQKLLTVRYANQVLRSLSESDFEWAATGGYYGQEMDYVRPVESLGWNKIRDKFNAWNRAKSDNARVELFLLEEYNKVLVPGATYPVVDVVFDNIDAEDALLGEPKVDTRFVDRLSYETDNLNGLIVLKQSGDKYKLVDGRHRYSAIKETRKYLGKKRKPKYRIPSVVSDPIKCIAVVPPSL